MTKFILAGAAVLALAVPAWATSIPSVASGEAADREAALTSALRHAVEQVVGMSVDTSTYVSNLKSIQDKVFTGSTGYIEKYDIIDEQRTPNGYRLTVSALVSKEKLNAAVRPLVGSSVAFDGKAATANISLSNMDQAQAETQLKDLLDELEGPAFDFDYTLETVAVPDDPTQARVYFRKLKIELKPEWYERYKAIHAELRTKPYAQALMDRAQKFLWEPDGIRFLHMTYEGSNDGKPFGYLQVDLLDGDKVLYTVPLQETVSVYFCEAMGGNVLTRLTSLAPLPTDPPTFQDYPSAHIQTKLKWLQKANRLRLRNVPFTQLNKW